MRKEEKVENHTNSNLTFALIGLLILFSSLTIFTTADYSMVIAFKPSNNLPTQPPAIPNQEQQTLPGNLTKPPFSLEIQREQTTDLSQSTTSCEYEVCFDTWSHPNTQSGESHPNTELTDSNFSPIPPLPKYLHPTTDCNPDNPCS